MTPTLTLQRKKVQHIVHSEHTAIFKGIFLNRLCSKHEESFGEKPTQKPPEMANADFKYISGNRLLSIVYLVFY